MQCINAKEITIFLYLHDVKIIFFHVFIFHNHFANACALDGSFFFFAIEKLQVYEDHPQKNKRNKMKQR